MQFNYENEGKIPFDVVSREEIEEKIRREIEENQGDGYDFMNSQFRSQVSIRRYVFAFTVDVAIMDDADQTIVFGDFVSVKRVR